MKKFVFLAGLVVLATATCFADQNHMPSAEAAFDSGWTFANFNGGGTGGLSGGQGFITHPGGGGMGGILYADADTSAMVNGAAYDYRVKRSWVTLGPSAVCEMYWANGSPSDYGGGDYPGGTAASTNMIRKDDCWGSECGSTGGLQQMPVGVGTGATPTWNTGNQAWIVVKVSGWGGGTETVNFDDAEVFGASPVEDWMLY